MVLKCISRWEIIPFSQGLPCKQNSASSRETGPLVIHFSDPTTANHCIDHHIALWGRLLPMARFIQHTPWCFNCYHKSHLTCSCKQKPSCGLCVEGHNTWDCRCLQEGGPSSQSVPLKCIRCKGSQAPMQLQTAAAQHVENMLTIIGAGL